MQTNLNVCYVLPSNAAGISHSYVFMMLSVCVHH